ncbi:hypothetical protein V6N13_104591 [Hibiscus sabdariffa]
MSLRLKVETDCDEAAHILIGSSMALDGNILVSEIHEILARDWTVKIRCVRRVASAVADRLAALSKGKPKLPLNLLRH